jgi:DNA repair exonuclease SbcCD nuclease subunit
LKKNCIIKRYMKTLMSINKNFTKIIQIADVHIRLNKRKDEYQDVFNKFFNLIKSYSKEETIICILGDVFHSKNDLQPEAIELCNSLLKGCTNLFPTVVVSGNHDAILNNKSRLDSLTPIVDALNLSNLFYLKENGLYGIGNILFNNMSIFSDPTEYVSIYRHF